MVNSARGRLYKVVQQGKTKPQNRYLISIPKDLWIDSMFPCHLELGESVKVTVRVEDGKLVVEDCEKT